MRVSFRPHCTDTKSRLRRPINYSASSQAVSTRWTGSREPPLTTAMAVARLKRYLPNPVLRIDLHDLVMSKVDTVNTVIRAIPYPSAVSFEQLDAHFTELLTATTPLLHLLVTGVHHDDGSHTQLWVDVLQRLLDLRQTHTGNPTLLPLQRYPALLALQTMNLVAVERGRDDLFIGLLTAPKWADVGREPTPSFDVLHLQRVLEEGMVNGLPQWGANHPGGIIPAATSSGTTYRPSSQTTSQKTDNSAGWWTTSNTGRGSFSTSSTCR